MSALRNSSRVPTALLFGLYIIVSIAAWGAVDQQTLSIGYASRAVAAGSFFVVAGYLIVRNKTFPSAAIIGACIFIVLLSIGFLASGGHNGLQFVTDSLAIDAVMVLAGLFTIGLALRDIDQAVTALMLVIYVLLWLFVLILTGGLQLFPIPQFKFDFALYGLNIQYSQGISKLFSIGAIAAIVFWVSASGKSLKLGSLAVSLVFLALAFIGGARGDSAAAALVVLAVITWKSRSALALVICGTTAGLVLAMPLIEQLVIFDRFQAMERVGLGAREMLYRDAIEMILSREDCALLGCGFGAFRAEYGYGDGLYVHNILIESAIFFGVPISVLFYSFSLFSLARIVSRNLDKNLLFVGLFMFFFLISLKSGTLLSSWFAFSSLLVASGIELRCRFRR